MLQPKEHIEEMNPLSGVCAAAVTRMNGADIVHGAVLRGRA
jgi:hypothetical protein